MIAVFAPSITVTVTVEAASDGSDSIHLHPGGQGIWVARMLRLLGERPALCAPVGGETGRALDGLINDWGIELHPIATAAATPAYVHDRRNGDRDEVARSQPVPLGRHEVDELYNRTLELALAAGVCVVTGRPVDDVLPVDVYRRLASDLDESGVKVVGDLHGDELDAFLSGGPMRLLKVSDMDLIEDGRLDDGDRSEESAVRAIHELVEAGAANVVVSRAEMPAVAKIGGRLLRATTPALEVVDGTGSGDSMTAALAVGVARGLDPETMLRQACAAGAANVTRRGLGGARAGLVGQLMSRVTVERLDET